MLQVEGLTKYYGKNRGVNDLCLEVRAGEILGLLGPFGAGKTTALRCIMDLTSKDGGEVLLNGRRFDRRTPRMRAMVGYLPAESALYPGLRVGDVLRLHSRYYRSVDETYLGRLIRRLEIDIARRVRELTPAGRRKLNIVLALMHRPALILMDEAAVGLDPLTQEALFALLREERERGAAVLYASGSLSEVRRLCDRAAILRDGEIGVTDEVGNLVNGDVHLVTLECADAGVAQRLGSSAIEREGDVTRFLYEGEPDALIKELSGVRVRRLLVEEPSLEDVLDHLFQ